MTKILYSWIFTTIFGFGGVEMVSYWSDKPWINVNSSDIEVGEQVKVLCGVPIDYTGGTCRLFLDKRKTPIKTLQTHSYVCEFLLSSAELLKGRPVGTRTSLRCDYTLQNYVSISSDNKAVVVWGTAEKPMFGMSPQVVMMDGSVNLNCTPTQYHSTKCRFYRDSLRQYESIPCIHQVKVKKLMMWRKTSLFNEINFSCDYDRDGWEYFRSEESDPIPTLVVDPSRLQISTNQTNVTYVCDVPARVHDFVFSQTGSNFLSLEPGGKLVLEAINNSTDTFSQTC
ncbi:hypothetical protein AGOR_G00148700 [Albula goreensis]|uniref:Uncharacterized protein n=1 Tax=Albula goreensis TaxID=1534307 RepID=A0A8T3D790_9TELE|nr:hypothetical protein AGOR_G00148700 [Albula goreensis]